MKLRLMTWNINSVRLRLALAERLIAEVRPDILCLQEIKVDTALFPAEPFRDLGYRHIAVAGQKGYHGVAILSRIPFREGKRENWCDKGDARHLCVTLGDDIELHNFYVPAGGDIPDPAENEKFAHKLAFLDEMRGHFSRRKAGQRLVLVGDLNVAPLETDVWSHKQLLNVVSHTPIEVEKLGALRASLDWVDIMRRFVPPEQRLYTWWSYRARDWRASNRGRRLDHIWSTPALGATAEGMLVLDEVRDWPNTSDHVPVIADFDWPV